MNNRLLKELQEYHYDLKDSDGHWRENPIGFIYNCETSDENIKIIKKLLTIIMDSDYISIETKVFISSKGISIRDINEFINDARALKLSSTGKRLSALSYNNTCIKIRNDNSELEEYLDVDILRNIVKNEIESIREIKDSNNSTSKKIRSAKDLNKRLLKFQERFGENENYRSNLDLNIKNVTPQITSYMHNEEFFDMLSSLESYLVQRKEIIQNMINSNEEFVAYFNYLLSKQAIDDERVAVDRERLIRFLKNEDYMTGYGEESSSDSTQFEDVEFLDSHLRSLKADEVRQNENGDIQLSNYTAYDYDMHIDNL